MTFVPIKTSNIAGGFYSGVGTVSLSAGTVIKPQTEQLFGKTKSYSYNSTTGVFTLNSSKTYVIEADVMTKWSTTSPTFYVTYGFFDGSSTELPDSSRGSVRGFKASKYYSTYTLISDETALAVIDGASVSSFTWQIIATVSSVSGTTFTADSGGGSTSYSATRCRLYIREY
jgi:hypothetical protein